MIWLHAKRLQLPFQFGLLHDDDAGYGDEDKPKSRMLCAIPFNGKDCPSVRAQPHPPRLLAKRTASSQVSGALQEASEFAQPDCLIGLSIMAYRYEGIRKENLKDIVKLLKRRFQGEAGVPEDERTAAVLFNGWREDTNLLDETNTLKYFNPDDPDQIDRLYSRLQMHRPTINHWLREHVFPITTMHTDHQLSASGSELGGDVLFGTKVSRCSWLS